MPSAKEMTLGADKKKRTTFKSPPKKSLQPQSLSTEYIKDSESSSGEGSDADSNSEADSLPENPMASKFKQANKEITQMSKGNSSSESEDESASESEEGSSIGDSEEIGSDESVETSITAKTDRGTENVPKLQKVTAPKPHIFNPPSGFELASIDETPQISQLFSGSNLEGKEVWYITAPASVPLSSIEDLSLQAIDKHEKILSHNGDGYSFFTDVNKGEAATKVMIPSSSKSGYHTRKTSISRTLHLQQTIPRARFTSKVTTAAIKPVRQQPSGLKMRFYPIGFEPVPSDQEMPDAPTSGFRKAGSISSSQEDSSDDNVEVPPSKPRKKPKTLSVESNKADGHQSKRKHVEGESRKSKHSSFKSEATADDRKLKIIKTQAKDKRTPDSPSTSTEIRSNPPPILPPKHQSTTRIVPPGKRTAS